MCNISRKTSNKTPTVAHQYIEAHPDIGASGNFIMENEAYETSPASPLSVMVLMVPVSHLQKQLTLMSRMYRWQPTERTFSQHSRVGIYCRLGNTATTIVLHTSTRPTWKFTTTRGKRFYTALATTAMTYGKLEFQFER